MLAKVGLLPRRLGQVQPPSCAYCIYGSMTRRPWRGKQAFTTRHKIKPAHHAGQCVSVDQMESTVPGFVAQLKRRLTIKRYTAATMFVDHYSRL
eukprot:13440113-Ditylum_brightwellii.AAC.1